MKKFREILEKTTNFKVGDKVNFHNDLGKMMFGEIIKINKDIITIEKNGIKFKRKISEVYEM